MTEVSLFWLLWGAFFWGKSGGSDLGSCFRVTMWAKTVKKLCGECFSNLVFEGLNPQATFLIRRPSLLSPRCSKTDGSANVHLLWLGRSCGFAWEVLFNRKLRRIHIAWRLSLHDEKFRAPSNEMLSSVPVP